MIKTDGTAMQPVTPNSRDSYNLADMGPDRSVGLHAVARGQREDGDLRLGGERIARATGQSPTTPGVVPGLVAERWPDRVHQQRLLGSSCALALHGATERVGARSADASTVPAFGCPPGVLSERTARHLRIGPALRRLLLQRPVRGAGVGGNPEAGAPAVRCLRAEVGDGAIVPTPASPRVSSRSRAGRRARSSGSSRCSVIVRSDSGHNSMLPPLGVGPGRGLATFGRGLSRVPPT